MVVYFICKIKNNDVEMNNFLGKALISKFHSIKVLI